MNEYTGKFYVIRWDEEQKNIKREQFLENISELLIQ